METKTDDVQTKRHRSPAYPSIDLATAVQKTALLYEGIKRNPTHVDIAVTTMGYMLSSTGRRAVAAMISYGLLEEEGASDKRTVRLTKDALALQHLAADDPDRASILQKLALRPKIFQELIANYPGQLPNDATIEKYLKVTREFNPEAVKPLIKCFRSTYQFANLENTGILSYEEGDSEAEQAALDFQEEERAANGSAGQRQPPPPKPPTPPLPPQREEGRNVRMSNQEDMRTLTIPLPGERIAFLDVPAHSSANDFRFMQKYLELMQDAWVNHPNVQASASTAPSVRFGTAIWHGPDTDGPVKVIGYWGESNGKHYVMIEGSDTGVPLDEITYDEA